MSAVDVSARRLRANTLWNVLGQGVPLLVAVWAIAALLGGLGEAAFGVLGLAWALVAIFGEMGLARAGTRFAAAALGRGEVDRARAALRRVARWQVGLGLAGAAALALATGPAVRLLGIEPEVAGEAVAAFRWVALVLPVLTWTAVVRGGLEAIQAFGRLNLIRAVGVVGVYLAPVAVVAAGGGVATAVASLIPVRAAMAVGYAVALHRALRSAAEASGTRGPEPDARGSTPEDDAREILSFGLWVSVSTVVSPLLVYADRFLLVGLVSTAAGGIYTAPFEAVTRVLLVPAALASTLFPAVASLQSGPEPHRLRGVARNSALGIAALVLPVALLLGVLAPGIAAAWLGESVAPQTVPVIRWLLVGLIANSVALVPFSVVQGLGRADLTGIFHLIELPIHLAVATWAILRWGVVGAAIAWSIRAWLDAILLSVAARRLLPAESGRSVA